MKFIHFIAIFIILFHCVEHKKLQKSFEEIFGDGWHLKEMGEEGEEKEEEANLGEEKEKEANLAQIMAHENDKEEDHSNHPTTNKGGGSKSKTDHNKEENEQQKSEIIRKFREIKERIKQEKGKQTNKEWNKIECTIAKNLGKNRDKIYKWIKELGLEMKRKITEEEKGAMVRKFRAIKEQIKQQKGKQSSKKRIKIERIIAKKVGTNRDNIYQWIRELGMSQKRTNEEKLAIMRQYWEMKRNDPKMSDTKITKALKVCRDSIRKWKDKFGELEMGQQKKKLIVTNEQKRKIVREFQIIKERIKQKGRKFSRDQWNKIENLLAKKLGTNRSTIYKWSRKLEMGTKKRNERRVAALMRQYWEMKRNDPKMSDRKIAKALKIDRGSIGKWKGQFGEEGIREEEKDAF